MGKKKRDYVEKHKQSLGDQLEDPESWGVRVSRRRRQRLGQAPQLLHCVPTRRWGGLSVVFCDRCKAGFQSCAVPVCATLCRRSRGQTSGDAAARTMRARMGRALCPPR